MVMRSKVWNDRSVQGVLVGRVFLYWMVAILYSGLSAACFDYYAHPDWQMPTRAHELLRHYWPCIPSLILFIPLVVYDIIRLSNHFAGPIYRMRQHLQDVVANPGCPPLCFRNDDYWQDLVVPINQLQDELLAARIALQQALEPTLAVQHTMAGLATGEQQVLDSHQELAESDSPKAKGSFILPPLGREVDVNLPAQSH